MRHEGAQVGMLHLGQRLFLFNFAPENIGILRLDRGKTLLYGKILLAVKVEGIEMGLGENIFRRSFAWTLAVFVEHPYVGFLPEGVFGSVNSER